MRVRGLDEEGEWTAWSEVRRFRADLVRLVSYPETYCASGVGPYSEASFGYEVTMLCDLAFNIIDGLGRTVWQIALSSPPGVYAYAWPGIALCSDAFPIPFGGILAPPGSYAIVITATGGTIVTQAEETHVEFSVVW